MASACLLGLLLLARGGAGASAAPGKSLTEATMNPRLKDMEYAVVRPPRPSAAEATLAATRTAASIAPRI